MNYFEVLYKNCFGAIHIAIVATPHDTPATPTTDFNFSWNGNRLISYRKTDYKSYSTNTYRYFAKLPV